MSPFPPVFNFAKDSPPTCVTVQNALHPGIYHGELQFMFPGQATADALTIPVELHLDAVPQVVPVAAALAWQVVNCTSWLDCQLAAWLLPASAVQDEWPVWLDNQTPQTVTIANGTAVLQGTASAIATTPNQIAPLTPAELPANQAAPLTVTIHRQQLAPDSYQGTLRLTIEGADEPLSIPTTLAVRQGPLWAFVVVLLGILLGRLVRDMETPVAQMQIKLMPDYLRVQAAAANLQEAQDRADAQAQLAQFKQALEQGQQSEEVLRQQLAALEARVSFYAALATLAADLPAGLRDRLLPEFANARSAVRDGRWEEAQTIYQTIQQTIDATRADGYLGVREQMQAWEQAVAMLGESVGRMATAVQSTTTSRGLRLLAWLSGIRLSAGVRFWVVRPIVSLVLLVLLVLLGMQALYINAGATFGAGGVYDYVGLVLWGLTADVTSRTLSSLSAKPG